MMKISTIANDNAVLQQQVCTSTVKLTKEQYEQYFADFSNYSVEELHAMQLHAYPDEKEMFGWIILHESVIEDMEGGADSPDGETSV